MHPCGQYLYVTLGYTLLLDRMLLAQLRAKLPAGGAMYPPQ